MANGPDYYALLGVEKGASAEELKAAYRKAALKHHPDRNPGDPSAETKFKEVSEAYHVLSDPDRRAHYDRFGTAPSGQGMPDFSNFANMEDLFEVFGDLLQGLGGVGRGRRAGGRAVQHTVEITLEECAKGTEKAVEFERLAECEACQGRGAAPGTSLETCSVCAGRGEVRFRQGFFQLTRPCNKCNGRGTVARSPCEPCKGAGVAKRTERLSVTLPPGVEDGATRTVPGYGEAPGHGLPTGDLELTIRIKPHPLFERDDADLRCTVPVSFPQAALGAMIEVPTLDGRVKMRLPAGTQPGQELRLRNRGMPRFGGYGRGDQLVTVQLEVPTALTAEQQELVERLAQSMNEETHPQRRTFLEKLKGLWE
jgi:molecular chaperone DnaJ